MKHHGGEGPSHARCKSALNFSDRSYLLKFLVQTPNKDEVCPTKRKKELLKNYPQARLKKPLSLYSYPILAKILLTSWRLDKFLLKLVIK